MTSTANIYTNDSVVGNTGFKGYTGTNNTGVNNGTNNTGVNKNIHNLSNMNPFISLLYHIKIMSNLIVYHQQINKLNKIQVNSYILMNL